MSFVEAPFGEADVVVCRTGYTGERGYELIAPNAVAVELWDRLLEAGAPYDVLPCGLGSRDTPRTGVGYPLHGQTSVSRSRPGRPGSGGPSAGRRTHSGARP